jgi:hypothetical protein
MDRDVGQMGEAVFAQWCAGQGITANSSRIDKTGWDFLIEFDFHPISASDPVTIHAGAYECKVQVKATDSQHRQWGVKLSNLRRMATATMPCFFLFIEFDKQETPQRAYLRHVDHELCTKILKRVHEVEIEGKGKQLHTRKMTIKYDDAHQLEAPTGLSLVTAMRAHIPDSVESYVRQKMTHIESAGFDEGHGEMTFFVAEEDMENFVDLTLGIRSELKVADVEGVAKRFGKKSREPIFKEDSGTLEFIPSKPDYEGRVKFRTDTLSPYISLPAKLHISGLMPVLPKELAKFRIDADFFELVFNLGTGAATYTFKATAQPIDIHQLLNGLKVAQMFSQLDRSIDIEVDMPPLQPLKFPAKSQQSVFPFDRALFSAVTGLKILSSMGISQQAKMSFAQAEHYAPRISALNELLQQDAINFKPSFDLQPEQVPTGQTPLYLMFYLAPIGNMIVGVFLSLVGFLIEEGNNRYSILGRTKTIEKTVAWERGDEVDTESLVAIMAALEEKYEADYCVFCSVDKKSFRALNKVPPQAG